MSATLDGARVAKLLGDAPVIDRTTMNAWEDANVTARVDAIGKDKLVVAGLWTSVCIVGPVLSALEQGFARAENHPPR